MMIALILVSTAACGLSALFIAVATKQQQIIGLLELKCSALESQNQLLRLTPQSPMFSKDPYVWPPMVTCDRTWLSAVRHL